MAAAVCLTASNSQASDSDMLSVVTSLNDKFDSTAALYSDHITSLNQAASVMYSNATQSLQVIITTTSRPPPSLFINEFDRPTRAMAVEMKSILMPPMQVLSELLTQTLAQQSIIAKTAAATALLLQGNLLNTISPLPQSPLDSLTTQLAADGYTDLLATVLGNFTECLRRAASNPKTTFAVFRYSSPPTDDDTTTAPASSLRYVVAPI